MICASGPVTFSRIPQLINEFVGTEGPKGSAIFGEIIVYLGKEHARTCAKPNPPVEALSPEYLAKVDKLEKTIYQKLSHLPSFNGVRLEDIWKLVFMERDRIPEGKFTYDKNEEKGYLAGIYHGYIRMLDTLQVELSPELVLDLHDASVEGVVTEDHPEGVPKGFRKYSDGKEAFGLKVTGDVVTASKRGFEELLFRWKNYHFTHGDTGDQYHFIQQAMDNPIYTITNAQRVVGAKQKPKNVVEQPNAFGFHPSPRINLKPTRPESCRADLMEIIRIYNGAPKRNQKEILMAVGALCQNIDQRHVFVDGNIRTSGILIANRELLRNGLRPSAMRDVNQLDCLHLCQIEQADGPGVVEALIEGQEFVLKNLTLQTFE